MIFSNGNFKIPISLTINVLLHFFPVNEDIQQEECMYQYTRNVTVTEARSFYSSTEWAMKIDSTLNSYATIPLPSQLFYTQSLFSPNMYLTLTAPRVLTPIIIPPQHDVKVTYWSFAYCISQSTILGRTGSNACTFIALLFSKMFFFLHQMTFL